uniref:Uncharacterized protein n=1 Tax=Salix viminalis TaxID=40686 RepID=A0A6N2MNE4_SALVM
MGDSDKKTSSDISSDRYSMVFPNNGADHGREEMNLSEEGGWSSSGSVPETLPPRRRGLATSYDGKCKSFADLSEARTVKDLQKKEHPFNQMRALLKARKLCRRSTAQIGSAEVVGKGNP